MRTCYTPVPRGFLGLLTSRYQMTSTHEYHSVVVKPCYVRGDVVVHIVELYFLLPLMELKNLQLPPPPPQL